MYLLNKHKLNEFAYKPINDKKLNTIYQKRNNINNRIGNGSNKYMNKIVSEPTSASRSILNDILDNKTPTEAKKNLAKTIETSKKNLDNLSTLYKSKTKLLTKKHLAIATGAIVGTGLLAAGINKLRKSRSDKNKKRGKYNIFK